MRRTDSAGRVIEYTYDAAGNLTSRVTASQTLVYRYDERNRLVAVESSVAGGPVRITRYAYDAHGTRTRMIASDGTTTDYRYDRRSRLRELTQRSAAAVLLFSATYATDAAGLRTGITEADEAGTTRTVAYDYDQTRRLTREIIDHRDATRDRTTAWTYDRVGNRLTQVTSTGAGATQATTTVTSTYDANDRLTSEDERTGSAAPRITTTTYDANGNTTRKESTDGVTEYAWDDANRLKEQRTASGRTEYRYDADGLRIGQTTYPTTGTPKRTDYVVDPTYAYANVIERWEGEGTAGAGAGGGAGGGSGALKLAVVHVFGEGVIGQVSCTPTPTSAPTDCPNAAERVLHADGFGSTRYLTNPAGTITDRIDYDAFGNEIAKEGDTDVEHLYRGEQYDANLEYYYLRARYMDPARGRFASMDSWPGDVQRPSTLHKFMYADADPITHFDPSGFASSTAELGVAFASSAIISVGARVVPMAAGMLIGNRVNNIIASRTAARTCAARFAQGLRSFSQNDCADVRMPIVFMSEALMPGIGEHVMKSQAQGSSAILNRTLLLKYTNRALNLMKCAVGSTISVFRSGGSCDEYPFASTYQGGLGATVAKVPLPSNWTQGGVLRAFYAGCFVEPDIFPLNEFLVVPVATAPASGNYQCRFFGAR